MPDQNRQRTRVDDEATWSGKSFWMTMPGLLTGLAALITAIVAVVGLFKATSSANGAKVAPGSTPPSSTATRQQPESRERRAGGGGGGTNSGTTVGATPPGGEATETRRTGGSMGTDRTGRDRYRAGGANDTHSRSSGEETANESHNNGTVRATRDGVAPDALTVSDVRVRADPFTGDVTCPVTVVWTGDISVSRGSGILSFRWVRSDGALSPVQTVVFDGPGTERVSTEWTLGAPGQHIVQTQRIDILEPAGTPDSDDTGFDLTCMG